MRTPGCKAVEYGDECTFAAGTKAELLAAGGTWVASDAVRWYELGPCRGLEEVAKALQERAEVDGPPQSAESPEGGGGATIVVRKVSAGNPRPPSEFTEAALSWATFRFPLWERGRSRARQDKTRRPEAALGAKHQQRRSRGGGVE